MRPDFVSTCAQINLYQWFDYGIKSSSIGTNIISENSHDTNTRPIIATKSASIAI